MNLTSNDLLGFFRGVWGSWWRRQIPVPALPPDQPRLGGPTYSGSWVSRWGGHSSGSDSGLQVSAVWRCVNLIAEQVGNLPLLLYKTKGNGEDRERARKHPLYRVLRVQPNRYMSAIEFKSAMTSQLCLWGNAYARKELDSSGEVVGLTPLNAQSMRVEPLADGTAAYYYQNGRNTLAFAQDSILHLKGFSLDGYVGLAPLAFARQTIGGILAAEDYMARFFDHDGKTPGVLTLDRNLTKDQRAEILKSFQGLVTRTMDERDRLNVLEFGSKYQPISIPPTDAQMLETRQFQVTEICRFYGVPEVLAMQTTNSTSWGTGIEQQNQGFLQYTLQPYLTRWEQAVSRQLLSQDDQLEYYAEHLVDALLRADSKARSEFYASAAQNGYMTRNEIRRAENLPALEGGDFLTVQVNLAPLSSFEDSALPQQPQSGEANNVQSLNPRRVRVH